MGSISNPWVILNSWKHSWVFLDSFCMILGSFWAPFGSPSIHRSKTSKTTKTTSSIAPQATTTSSPCDDPPVCHPNATLVEVECGLCEYNHGFAANGFLCCPDVDSDGWSDALMSPKNARSQSLTRPGQLWGPQLWSGGQWWWRRGRRHHKQIIKQKIHPWGWWNDAVLVEETTTRDVGDFAIFIIVF